MLSRLSTPSKWWKWITAGAVFAIMMIFSAVMNITDYQWDAFYNWNLSEDVIFGETIDLLKFPATFRGYLLPTMISCFKYLAVITNHGIWGWRVLIALMISALLAFILPALFSKKTDTPLAMLRTLLCLAVLLWIWGYYLQFPLSDFPTVFFLCAGAALFLFISRSDRKIWVIILLGIICGWCFYAAYNTRVTSLYGILLLLVLVVIYERKRWKKLLPGFAAVFLGIMIAAAPQMVINHQYVNSYLPKVYTDLNNGEAHDMMTQQVYWGIQYPRYTAYIGDQNDLPYGQAFFDDPAGQEILKKEGITEDSFHSSMVFNLFLKYPLDMTGIYVRHFISGLTPTHTDEPYIRNMYPSKGLLITVSVLIWMYAALVAFLILKKTKRRWKDFLILVALCIPFLLQMAGAVETRFLLMLYVFAYFGVFVVADPLWVWKETKGKRLPILFGGIVVYLLWIALIGDILSMYRSDVLLIGDCYLPS